MAAPMMGLVRGSFPSSLGARFRTSSRRVFMRSSSRWSSARIKVSCHSRQFENLTTEAQSHRENQSLEKAQGGRIIASAGATFSTTVSQNSRSPTGTKNRARKATTSSPLDHGENRNLLKAKSGEMALRSPEVPWPLAFPIFCFLCDSVSLW